jgi:hypothetical protein
MQILNIIISLIIFGIIPGLLLFKYIPFKKLNPTHHTLFVLSSIPILSLLYWLTYSQIYWVFFKSFDFSVIISGLVILVLISLLSLISKRIKKLKPAKNIFDKKIILLGFISIIFASTILLFSYKEQSFFPINYDTQTHGTIIKKINLQESIDSKSVWLDDTSTLNDTKPYFYPIGFHIYTSLWAKVIQTEPLVSLMITVTFLILILPLLTAFVTSAIFKEEKYTKYLPYIVILITPFFYYFPYGALEWGGIAQFASQVIMLYMIGVSFNLIDTFSIYSKKTIITTGIFGILLFLIHPATAFTLLVILLIKGWKDIFNLKPLLNKPFDIVIALIIFIAIAVLLLSPILSDLGAFFDKAIISKTARPVPGQDEDFFSLFNFAVAFPASFRQWFINGSTFFLIPFLFQFYSWGKIAFEKFKKSTDVKDFLKSYKLPYPELLISFAVILLIIGFARGASNLPIINNITAVYYHSYRRVAYYLNIPIILISAFGLLNLWRCVNSKKKIYTTLKRKRITNTLIFAIIIVSTIGILGKLRNDITTKDYDQEVQVAFESLIPKVKSESAYIIHLPNYYPDDRENELNWISTQNTPLIPFINRTHGSMMDNLLDQRLEIANIYETTPNSICEDNALYSYGDVSLEFIYLSLFDIRGQEMKDESKIEFYERYNSILQELNCVNRLVETENISIWEIQK